MADKPDYSNFVRYLQSQRGEGAQRDGLCVVAARAKISEYILREIADGEREIDEETALALSLVVEPEDDQWMLDPEHALDAIPDLTDAEIIQRLQHAQDNGKLGVVAHVSGVKGGVQALHDICHIGQNAKLDQVTRMLLLNVME